MLNFSIIKQKQNCNVTPVPITASLQLAAPFVQIFKGSFYFCRIALMWGILITSCTSLRTNAQGLSPKQRGTTDELVMK